MLLTEQCHGFAAVHCIFDDHTREGVAQALLYQIANERGVIHNQHIDFTHRYSS
ncbi:hypothetical protein PS623_03977 [Pseudomonas fluorescens]|nr:hypothetical protein PS623_03977 [Pseudomonas fluorescens]